MKKYIIFLSVSYFLFLIFFPARVSAAIRYPIRELENCRNERECKLYCDIPENTPACWSYNRYKLGTNVLGVTTITDETTAQKNNITFPIEDLGNCASAQECRDFCRLDENKTACTDFALTKKLQKTRVKEIRNDVLQKARTELGCDSKTSCHNYCRKPENQEICSSFGLKYDLLKKSASGSAAVNPQIFTKSASELGCSNEISCKNLCNNPDNKSKCQAFAAKYGLSRLTGTQKAALNSDLIGSGLCKNEVECAAYCQKNPDSCPGFKPSTGSGKLSDTQSNIYLGPNGCRTQTECFQFCQANPDKCPAFPKKSLTPITKSTPTPFNQE